jgi:hypothetical protein
MRCVYLKVPTLTLREGWYPIYYGNESLCEDSLYIRVPGDKAVNISTWRLRKNYNGKCVEVKNVVHPITEFVDETRNQNEPTSDFIDLDEVGEVKIRIREKDNFYTIIVIKRVKGETKTSFEYEYASNLHGIR